MHDLWSSKTRRGPEKGLKKISSTAQTTVVEPEIHRARGKVPCGPDEKDKRLPPSVAQGD